MFWLSDTAFFSHSGLPLCLSSKPASVSPLFYKKPSAEQISDTINCKPEGYKQV